MANTFLTCQEIARVALPILQDNLVFPALTYKDYSNEFQAKGDTIQVKKPAKFTASEFNGSISTQDTTEGNVLVKLDKIADVSTEITAKEMALNIGDFTKQVLEPAMIAIAEKINKDGLELYKDIPYVAGTAGTTPDDLEDFANPAKVLNNNKAPMNDRAGVWDAEALAKFQVIPAVVNAEKSGSTAALREGSIGRVIGLDNYMSQAVCQHTVGATGTPLIDGAATAGATQIHCDGLNTAFKQGDLFTIAGDSTVYTVTVPGALSTADQDIDIYPALAKNAADNAAITVITSHKANLVFQKNAFAFVNRPLEVARGVESYVTNHNGISLRVTMGYDMSTKKQTLSIDSLYGYKTLYPELACRMLG